MIGAKTIVALGVLVLAIGYTAVTGLLNAEHLGGLDRETCLLLGVFAALATALLSVLWRPDETSRSYLGVLRRQTLADDESALISYRATRIVVGADESRAPRDLPGWAQQSAFAAFFLCVALVAFDDRAAAQITAIPASVADLSLFEYCDDEPAVTETRLEPPPAPAPPIDTQGCALILRAYELGYTEDLGDCGAPAAPAPTATEDSEPEKPARCTLRRRDEPILHYVWRLLSESTDELGDVDPMQATRQGAREFEIKLDYLGALYGHTFHAVQADPRASHHLFTNLPAPRSIGWPRRWLTVTRCTAGHGDMALRLDWQDHPEPASGLLEHAFDHLLFNPRFGAVTQNCREYTLHWDAAEDVCARLVAEPEQTLDDADALDAIRAVIDRHAGQERREALAAELDDGDATPSTLPPLRSVVSAQCLIVAAGAGSGPETRSASGPDGRPRVTHQPMLLDGHTLRVRELRVPRLTAAGGAQLAVYDHLASLLSGSRYSGPARDAAPTRLVEPVPTPDALDGPDDAFLLARLEPLRTADPFLATTPTAAWAVERAELVDVYPFFFHLHNVIDAFRRRYQAQRGRL